MNVKIGALNFTHRDTSKLIVILSVHFERSINKFLQKVINHFPNLKYNKKWDFKI